MGAPFSSGPRREIPDARRTHMRAAPSFMLLTFHDLPYSIDRNTTCRLHARSLNQRNVLPSQRNAEALAASIQGIAADTEPRGRERHVAVTFTDVSQHIVADGRCGRRVLRRGRGMADGLIAKLTRQVTEPHDASVADRQRGADHVAQLAHVSWPVIRKQPLKCSHFDGGGPLVTGLGGKKLAYQPFLVGARGERWQLERDSVEAIVEILSEFAARDHARGHCDAMR